MRPAAGRLISQKANLLGPDAADPTRPAQPFAPGFGLATGDVRRLLGRPALRLPVLGHRGALQASGVAFADPPGGTDEVASRRTPDGHWMARGRTVRVPQQLVVTGFQLSSGIDRGVVADALAAAMPRVEVAVYIDSNINASEPLLGLIGADESWYFDGYLPADPAAYQGGRVLYVAIHQFTAPGYIPTIGSDTPPAGDRFETRAVGGGNFATLPSAARAAEVLGAFAAIKARCAALRKVVVGTTDPTDGFDSPESLVAWPVAERVARFYGDEIEWRPADLDLSADPAAAITAKVLDLAAGFFD